MDEPLVGQVLPPVEGTPTTRDLVRFAHAANDSAPLHYDQDYARSRGFQTVIVHGALKASYMAQVLTQWAGERGWVAAFRSEYRAPDLPGRRLTAAGRVTAVDRVDGRLRVQADLWVDNENGETTTRGSGVVVFDDEHEAGDPLGPAPAAPSTTEGRAPQ